jgi:hypothetical protein
MTTVLHGFATMVTAGQQPELRILDNMHMSNASNSRIFNREEKKSWHEINSTTGLLQNANTARY